MKLLVDMNLSPRWAGLLVDADIEMKKQFETAQIDTMRSKPC